jgi:hypothetical protein
VVGISDTLNSSSNYLQTFLDVGKDKTILEHHMKTLNLLYISTNDLCCSDEFWYKFKEGDLLKCLHKDKYPCLQQKVAVSASLFRSTFVNELYH